MSAQDLIDDITLDNIDRDCVIASCQRALKVASRVSHAQERPADTVSPSFAVGAMEETLKIVVDYLRALP
jgi:hypothetical protein